MAEFVTMPEIFFQFLVTATDCARARLSSYHLISSFYLTTFQLLMLNSFLR